jgi:hypothetical protein
MNSEFADAAAASLLRTFIIRSCEWIPDSR